MPKHSPRQLLAKQTLLRHLQGYPLYQPEHYAEAFEFACGRLCLTWQTKQVIPRISTTHLDLEVDGTALYLLSIGLDPEQRGQGLGKQLYALVEAVAADLGCQLVVTTPSGWTPRKESRAAYVQRLGYQMKGDEAYKIITPSGADHGDDPGRQNEVA